MKEIRGGCLCGQVRFEVDAEPIATAICYCRQCQKAAGAERADGIIIQSATFRLVQGSMKDYRSTADSGDTTSRTFCGHCGTQITAGSLKRPEVISVRTTTLDEPGRFKPQLAIFTEFAQPWSVIPSDIPTYRGSV